MPLTVGVTPVLADQLEAMRDGDPGDRFLRFLREVRAEVHDLDERGLRDTGFEDLARGGAPRRGGLRAGRRGVRGPRPRPDRRVRRAGGRRAVDLGGHPRAAAAGGHRARPGAAARHRHALARAALRPLQRRLLAARVRLRARAGARPGRPRRARSSASTSPERRCDRWPPRRDRSPFPSTGRRSRWSGTRAPATRPIRSTATTTTAPPTTCVRGATAASPTTRRLLAPRRTSTRATSSTASPARAAWSAARWTPSCSATGGTRAWSGSRPCSRRRRGAAWTWSRSSEGIERVEPVRARAAGVELGHGQEPLHLGLAAGGRARLQRPARRARACSRPRPHEGLARGLRELLALQSSDWAFLVTEDLAADYPLRRARGHEAGVRDALAHSRSDPALHNLAPDLDLASFCAP